MTIRAVFDVGSQTTSIRDWCDDEYTSVPFQVSWSASDPSGIWGYDVWKIGVNDGIRDYLGQREASDDRTLSDTLDDYDGDCGGGSQSRSGWAVTAYDNAGNARWQEAGRQPDVYQEDGTSASEPAIAVSRTGTWRISTCACASGGAQRYTTGSGASTTFTVPRAAREVGLLMAKGPGRGKFQVLLDGDRVATLDSYAAANTNRVVVWRHALTGGPHKVTVRNLATDGRPRIDVDALLVMRAAVWHVIGTG